ncbi:hypothetical protein BV25DRAFT_1619008 [Artomyces pyxidatus]|uniref:Uncharacterized protein n=1 Tax=Artomyces pyxidatus TaxID=48021 RepID=A0ACB8TC87_9AGAM|nr:hypothetical protein BV25DRAFT_1619008 [Artomyces pyxidatus]
MASGSDNHAYISPHSADVILSDIRPIRLQIEALHSLNALLDELLAKTLTSAQSLLTDRIKSGLLKILPTPLGKEALLEAEVELRAYWERTSALKSQAIAAEQSFDLQWAIELMRLKCEAYSTLNDSDEDAQAEGRLIDRLGSSGVSPPKALVVAPAALYFTAILECICEHILSNVGRVATRDSSRTTAGLQDLFVALCEDDSIYPLFKTMAVYDQIETSIKAPRPRRSKSISRTASERQKSPSPLPDVVRDGWARISSESSSISTAVLGSAAAPALPASRPSLDKARAIKLFKAHTRTSSDREAMPADPAPRRPDAASIDGPRKSISGQSDGLVDAVSLDTEDDAFDQQFDDLMRSGDTMKMSLTPDRLRTMESTKSQRSNKRQQPHKSRSSDNIHSHPPSNENTHPLDPRHHGPRRPSLHHVDSIIEDEEPREQHTGGVSPKQNGRRPEIPQIPQTHSTMSARIRSTSTSSGMQNNGRTITRKSSLGVSSPPVSLPQQMRDPRLASKQDSGMPQRTRKVQRKRESMDLDDIMNGSDGESEIVPSSLAPSTPTRRTPYAVSNSARDLINFLEEGPPPDPMSQRTATWSTVSLTPTTKSLKSGNRLQRMMSKLSLTGDKPDQRKLQQSQGHDPRTSPQYASAPSTPSLGSSLRLTDSNYSIPMPIAVKPVPPRIPVVAPISPPSSPSRASPTDDGFAAPPSNRDTERERIRKMSVSRKAVPNWDAAAAAAAAAAQHPLPPPPAEARMTPSPRPSLVPSYGSAHGPPPSNPPTTALPPRPGSAPRPSPSPSPVPPPSSVSPVSPQYTVPPGLNGQPNSRDRGAVNGHDKLEVNGRTTESPSPSRLEGSVSPAPSGEIRAANRENGYSSTDFVPKPVHRPRASRSRPPSDASSAPGRGSKRSQPPPGLSPPPPPSIPEDLALEMRRAMAKATNADECRLLVDMYLAKAGIAPPSPSLPDEGDDSSASSHDLLGAPPLEHSLVEMFLGDDDAPFAPVPAPAPEEGERSYPYTPEQSEDDIVRGLPTPPVDTHHLGARSGHIPLAVSASA